MRKAIYILFVTFFTVTITSCTSDNDTIIQIKLLKKVTEFNLDGTSSTYIFTYNGNKIESINSELNNKTFTYTNNLITKIVEMDKVKQQETTFDFIYKGDKLTKVICSDNYTLNYSYVEDGTVSYEKTTTDAKNNIVLLFHGNLSFQGRNVINNKKINDDAGVNVLSTEEVSFVYDTKRNPFNNITGYDKLLDHFKTISVNNTVSIVEITSSTNLITNQLVSSAIRFPSTIQYDNDNYPKEIVSENLLLGGNNSNHVKSVLFYD